MTTSVDVVLERDLVGSCDSGDTIAVWGILRPWRDSKKFREKRLNELTLFLEAHSIVQIKRSGNEASDDMVLQKGVPIIRESFEERSLKFIQRFREQYKGDQLR